jgi:hypothetical protein
MYSKFLPIREHERPLKISSFSKRSIRSDTTLKTSGQAWLAARLSWSLLQCRARLPHSEFVPFCSSLLRTGATAPQAGGGRGWRGCSLLAAGGLCALDPTACWTAQLRCGVAWPTLQCGIPAH